MMFLPKHKRRINRYLQFLFPKHFDTTEDISPTNTPRSVKNSFETLWSFGTCLLAVICLLLTVLLNTNHISQIISPVVVSIHNITSFNPFKSSASIKNTFSFIPGSVPSKFNKIDFQGLNVL